MRCCFSKVLGTGFDDAATQVTNALADKGFGVLTATDVRETKSNTLGVEFKPYKIHGVCIPCFAGRALRTEEKIGTMLGGNVIVDEHGLGELAVAAVDLMASMMSFAICSAVGPTAEPGL